MNAIIPPVNRCRGQASLLVIFMIIMLGSFALVATLIQRPAGQALDMHTAFASAQFAADSALQQALARLNSGKPATLAIEMSGGTANVDTKVDGNSALAHVSGRVPAEIILNGSSRKKWAVLRVDAFLVRAGDTGWHVKEYRLADSRIDEEP